MSRGGVGWYGGKNEAQLKLDGKDENISAAKLWIGWQVEMRTHWMAIKFKVLLFHCRIQDTLRVPIFQ